jgi:hypothetical protein
MTRGTGCLGSCIHLIVDGSRRAKLFACAPATSAPGLGSPRCHICTGGVRSTLHVPSIWLHSRVLSAARRFSEWSRTTRRIARRLTGQTAYNIQRSAYNARHAEHDSPNHEARHCWDRAALSDRIRRAPYATAHPKPSKTQPGVGLRLAQHSHATDRSVLRCLVALVGDFSDLSVGTVVF